MTSATNLGNQATFNNDQLTTNLGVFTNPSGEIFFWNGSQDLGKLYTYNFSFTLAKGYKSQAAKRRDSLGEDWEETRWKACNIAKLPTRHIDMWQHVGYSQLGKHIQVSVFIVFMGTSLSKNN